MVKEKAPVTLGEVASLPLVLDPVTAGRMLGFGRTTAYRLLREGAFPVPARRAGRVWVVPTAGVLAHLGIEPAALPHGGCGRCGARTDQKETES
ncbi:AlpA family transcriptional regulator [Nocardiopsis sp. CNT312]|uniref:helix-turn-helix transcriptional regulator n=1 Tax=Nocardiopsis sp. CNT312 TaxID=1137268 RepID=UPI00056AEE71|nr:hypothetical protein [Nocardiopsis sp. CNT312]